LPVCPQCEELETSQAILETFCSSEFALRIPAGLSVALLGRDLRLGAGGRGRPPPRLLKAGPLRPGDLRPRPQDPRGPAHHLAPPLVLRNGAACRCPQLETPTQSGPLLVMGGVAKDRSLTVTGIVPLGRRALARRSGVEVARAMRNIKANRCPGFTTTS
ncbi:unnamed protein product, partial [Lampetra planeri]